ncbi:GntR family transcriptional regulator [Polaromonas sp.]|uniref:GntR family transcriptional regulator n=1 Tax=Polaromonas sp. TaxID=1869339 RepID=UPI003BA8EDD7
MLKKKVALAVKRREADVAFDAIEAMISTLALAPGSPIVEAEISESIGVGRTPVREALMRLMSNGLVIQQPRRGLLVSPIDLANHLDVIETRRVLERLIAACVARRATASQRDEITNFVHAMSLAAKQGDTAGYMKADQARVRVYHAASRNYSAVNAVAPLVTQSRRFWYAYQHTGDIAEGVIYHERMAQGIRRGSEAEAVKGADELMDYLEKFTRNVIDG